MENMRENNFEVYTKNPRTGEEGWDIEMVSVIARSKQEAKDMLKKWALFDVVILFNFSIELKEPNASGLYTLSDTMKATEGTILITKDNCKSYRPILHTKE